jgi:papain like protease
MTVSTTRLVRYHGRDPRLGRHINHDPRHWEYSIAPKPRRALHSVEWTRRVPIFDQQNVGSCTFNASAGCLATDSKGRTGSTVAHIGKPDQFGIFAANTDYVVQEHPFVLDGYTYTTKIDPFPGDMPSQDTGSDGPSACQALVNLGLATKYTHAFTLDALKTGLQDGPVMWGTTWYNSMYDLDAHDCLVVDLTSGVAGGHEIYILGWDSDTGLYKIPNSWGEGFGDHGYFYARESDLVKLTPDGDFTQPVFATAPVPPKPITAQAFYDKIKAAAKAGGLK